MEHKILEIRDRITYISVLAIKMEPADEVEEYYLRRDGYSRERVTLMRLDTQTTHVNVYDWGVCCRTMQVAHEYIETHFDELQTGDVVDVEWVLSEVDKPKVSERFGR